MIVSELRKKAKELRVKRYSLMKKDELEEAIKEAEKEIWYKENVKCDECLREQHKQRLIDEQLYHQKLMENTIRRHCNTSKIIIDEDEKVCLTCGTVLGYDCEIGYSGPRVKHK